jgi:peptidyl-prolyl cis-trans isomerase A (cyclophilin A)
MTRRFALAALLLATALPAAAQEAAPPSSTPAAAKFATVRVALQTGEGQIVLELEKERAPITTANFLRYLDAHRLDGATFYRASKVASDPDFGLVQFGVRADPKRAYPPIAHEPTTKTGLSHLDGTISMARNAPGSATGDFFVTVGAMPTMDADPKLPGDNLGFAAFGRVVEGMEVIHRILNLPVSQTSGEGVMKGEMLAQPVRITSAKRLP